MVRKAHGRRLRGRQGHTAVRNEAVVHIAAPPTAFRIFGVNRTNSHAAFFRGRRQRADIVKDGGAHERCRLR